MQQELLAEIRQTIDQVMRPSLTLDELHEALLFHKVEDIEDRTVTLAWTIDGRQIDEKELGGQYTRAALIARGLVIQADPAGGGFVIERERALLARKERPGVLKLIDDLKALSKSVENALKTAHPRAAIEHAKKQLDVLLNRKHEAADACKALEKHVAKHPRWIAWFLKLDLKLDAARKDFRMKQEALDDAIAVANAEHSFEKLNETLASNAKRLQQEADRLARLDLAIAPFKSKFDREDRERAQDERNAGIRDRLAAKEAEKAAKIAAGLPPTMADTKNILGVKVPRPGDTTP